MTLLRLRAVQVGLAVLCAMTPKPYKHEVLTCFETLDVCADKLRAPAPLKTAVEVLQ